MKKARRSISLILAMLMIFAYPGMAFAEEQGDVAVPVNDRAAVTEESAADVPSEAAEPDAVSEEMSVSEEAENAPETETSEETAAPDADPTKVTVAKSIEDLSKKSEAANDNEAFFTIDASRKKTSADLATEEVRESVTDVLTSGNSVSDKQEELASTLADSGYYLADENGKSKVDVTSKFAYQRLRLVADKDKYIDAYGATKAVYYEGAYLLSYDSMEATKTAYDSLSEEYGNEAVHIDVPVKAENFYGWGTVFTGMDQEIETAAATGSTVTVAVIDTGITASHSVFNGRNVDITNSYDFVHNKSGQAVDDNGHGTATSGIIAESTPSNVKILPLKALNNKGEGSIFNAIHAVQYAESHGADIINMSLGGYLDEGDSLDDYEDDFNTNALIVCASGNENYDLDKNGIEEFPGELQNTVCVGSYNTQKTRSSFSNYGSRLDFAAPGTNVTVADTSGSWDLNSGTSFAAPYITAAAAIVKLENKNLNKNDIVSVLKNKSEDLGDSGKDKKFGWGCPCFKTSLGHVRGGDIGGGYCFVRNMKEKTTYTGRAITQNPSIIMDGETLVKGKDFTCSYSDNINAGTCNITFNGIGNYSGTVTGASFDIAPKNISPSIVLSAYSFKYTGKPFEPGVTVKDGNTLLTNGKDYTLAFQNNTYVGTASVVVKCKGNYSGGGTAGFEISDPYFDNNIKRASIKKPGRTKNAVTAKWKKQTGKTYGSRVTGYQVQIATNPGFTQNVRWATVKGYKKKSKKFGKLRRKTTYYVRVRTYMNRGGGTYYSGWSTVRSIKTK